MERYYRNSDARAVPYQRTPSRGVGQDVYNPIPTRFSNVHGVEGTRFSNQLYKGMCENMSSVNQQYSYNMSGNNVANVLYDCPTPDNIMYEGSPASFYPGYANNNEECTPQYQYRQATQDYAIHPLAAGADPSGERRAEQEPARPARSAIPAAPDQGAVVRAVEAAGNQNAHYIPDVRNKSVQPTPGTSGGGAGIKRSVTSGTSANTSSAGSAETGRSADGTYKAALDKQRSAPAGMRLFTGPVEKVLKWHKALQETGVNAIFEVIAKCVSIRSGPGCAKYLLLRDASGPVLQATYYEIDFLLPEVRPGSVLRVAGKMVGSNRLHALKVREARPGETPALPRLCAISQHVAAKLQAQHQHH